MINQDTTPAFCAAQDMPKSIGRDASLDAFRGLAVGGMILVNLQGNGVAAWRQAVHAVWNGITAADFVFPFFLLAVGMSAALTASSRTPPRIAVVMRRAALLFLIGMVLGWLLRPTLDPALVRWPGVLQRIAICFLGIALWSRVTSDWKGYLGLALGLGGLHWLFLQMAAPGEVLASFDRGQGVAGWSDRLLPGRLHGTTFDPEGVLSTLSALATTAIGAAAWQLRIAHSARHVAVFGGAMVLAGLVLANVLVMPLNKGLWTPSFAAVTAGVGILVWLALQTAWRHQFGAGVISFLAWLGRIALTFYVVHMVLLVVLRLAGPVPFARVWDLAWSWAAAVIPWPGAASMVFALIAGALCLGVTRVLEQQRWLLRV